MARGRPLAIAVCCAYPVLNHTAATLGEPALAAFGIALVAWVVGLRWLKPSAAAFAAASVLALSLWLAARFPGVLLYTPPIVINLGLFAIFARTLRRDSEPLVSRFARVSRGVSLAPDLARYTRNLTAAWATFFVVMAIISAALAVTGPVATWSLFSNLLDYLLVVAFFVVEYVYRRLRYRHHPHVSPWQMVMRLRDYKLVPRSSGEASRLP